MDIILHLGGNPLRATKAVEVGRTYHRHVRVPGDDVSDDCPELQAVAATLWTPEVIAAYQASLSEL
jgi:hypothetical protein